MEIIKLPAICVVCGDQYDEPIAPQSHQLTNEDERMCDECEHKAFLFPLVN